MKSLNRDWLERTKHVMVSLSNHNSIYKTSFDKLRMTRFIFLIIFLFLFSSHGITQTTQKVLNYPNPFAPPSQTTTMSYNLDENSDTKIYVLNSVGQVVRRLSFSSGTNGGKIGANTTTWDGLSNFGAVVPNGVYLLRIISGGGLAGKGKIVVLN